MAGAVRGDRSRSAAFTNRPKAILDIGSNVAEAQGHDLVAVMIDDIPLVGFRYEDGKYLLQANLFGENNDPILQIIDNELSIRQATAVVEKPETSPSTPVTIMVTLSRWF